MSDLSVLSRDIRSPWITPAFPVKHLGSGTKNSVDKFTQRFTLSQSTREIIEPTIASTSLLKNKKHSKVLVLDLDETLIYAKMHLAEKIDIKIHSKSKDACYGVISRPGLQEFLEKMSKWFTLVIYTASSRKYAETILNSLFPTKRYFDLILCHENCFPPNSNKDLSILREPLKNVILIDDNPLQAFYQKDNFLQIKPFTGDLEDRELINLIPFLTELAQKKDMRNVEVHYSEFTGNVKKQNTWPKAVVGMSIEKREDQLWRLPTAGGKLELAREESKKTLSVSTNQDTEDNSEHSEDETDEGFEVKNQIFIEKSSSLFILLKEDLGLKPKNTPAQQVLTQDQQPNIDDIA